MEEELKSTQHNWKRSSGKGPGAREAGA
jgi:hypothetical protein